MTYDVRWMPRARRQAAATQEWWIANRELAPTMFLDELARVIALLQNDPELGSGFRDARSAGCSCPIRSGSSTTAYVRGRSGSRSWPSGAPCVKSALPCRLIGRSILDRSPIRALSIERRDEAGG